jgi:hypothetical protein
VSTEKKFNAHTLNFNLHVSGHWQLYIKITE